MESIKMMKAAVVTNYSEPLVIKQMPMPKVGPNDVLVKLIACGVCHSDLHIAKGEIGVLPPLPLIVGHEGIGEVVELGVNVTDHVKKGDIIGVPFLQRTCLHCEYCLSGRETLCESPRRSGTSTNGCYAEYVTMDADFAIKLPSDMDPYTSAPLFCAGVTVYKALKVSGARPGEWVSIVGIGGLGSLGISYGVAMGLRVLAIVAPNDKIAVQLAKDMGAEEVYDGPSDKHGAWVQENIRGVQAAIITVPLVQAYTEAILSVKRGGRVVAVAMPNKDIPVPANSFIGKELQLIGSFVGTRKDIEEALTLAKLHQITCKVKRCKLEDINDVFEDMQNYKISGRVVIDFQN